MATKILPVELKPLITSECWNFYKFAIMQTISEFDIWLASHPKLFMQSPGEAYFGDGYIHPMSYYMELLEMTERDQKTVTSENLLDFVVSEVDKENYLIIYVNLRRLHDINTFSMHLHEIMIYGYDTDEQKFMTLLLLNGAWKSEKIGFKEFVAAYVDATNYFVEKENELYNLRHYFFPVTIVTPRHDYKNDDAYYDFIKQLQRELEGNVYVRQPYACLASNEKRKIVCTGLACIPYTKRLVQDVIFDRKEFEKKINQLRKSSLKVSEHQHMLLRSMRWFRTGISAKNSNLEMLINEYEGCCDMAKSIVLLFYKYSMSKDEKILTKIIGDLDIIYNREREIIGKMFPLTIALYINYLKEEKTSKVV